MGTRRARGPRSAGDCRRSSWSPPRPRRRHASAQRNAQSCAGPGRGAEAGRRSRGVQQGRPRPALGQMSAGAASVRVGGVAGPSAWTHASRSSTGAGRRPPRCPFIVRCRVGGAPDHVQSPGAGFRPASRAPAIGLALPGLTSDSVGGVGASAFGLALPGLTSTCRRRPGAPATRPLGDPATRRPGDPASGSRYRGWHPTLSPVAGRATMDRRPLSAWRRSAPRTRPRPPAGRR